MGFAPASGLMQAHATNLARSLRNRLVKLRRLAGKAQHSCLDQATDANMPHAATFDRTDLLLLAELQRNGRQTNAELADRVHLSPSACLRRVQRLERESVIAGYRAEVDPEKVGIGLQAFVRVQLVRHDAEAVATFAQQVDAWDEVVACHALTGDMDYLLQVAVRDLDHFSRFLLDRLLNQAGVADVNSSFVLRTVKAFRGLPLS